MSSIRGVSVGGNLYDVADTTNIAPKEPTAFASREYEVGRTFIMSDGLLYKATEHIAVGDAIVVNGNAERTNVDELFEATENVEAIPTMLNELGAKNLCPNNATSQTISGVTFTVNSDGSVRATGEATGGIAILTLDNTFIGEVGKRYVLSGCPSGGSDNLGTYYAISSYIADVIDNRDYGEGRVMEGRGQAQITRILVYPAAGEVDLLFYPMIRPASVADDTYVPYAKTNRELTNQFVVELVSYTGSTTVAHNNIVDHNFTISKNGYIPIGVVGHRINGVIGIVAASISVTSSTNVRMRLLNTTNSDLTANSLEVYVLYSKV